MALDDGAQIDPATLPKNAKLLESLDAHRDVVERERDRVTALAGRLAAGIPDAVARIEERVLARGGKYAREEELRGGIASALRNRGELVMTEAKLLVPGWTDKLGGFDLAIVVDDALVVAETKWADGNLYESMWDIFKLASALSIPRVDAAVAIYGAPTKHWARPDSCARLFEDRDILTPKLVRHFPKDWATNLAGSSAQPQAIPVLITAKLIECEPVGVLGKGWEVRAIQLSTDMPADQWPNGWPDGEPPTEAQAYFW